MTRASDKNLKAAGAESGHEELVTVVNGSRQASETPGAADVLGLGVDGVDEEVEEQVRRHVAQIRETMARTVEEVWRLGGALRAAKKQVRHGRWIPWLESRVRIPVRMAQRAMALYDRYPEMRQVSHFDSVKAAMRALPPVTLANQDKRADIATGETISVKPRTETTSAAQPTQESACETGRPGADTREPSSAEATTETSAVQPSQESACETARVNATAGETSRAEATTETTRAASSAHESVDEQERGSIDADEESLVNAATTDGAVPAAAERAVARDDRTLRTAGEDLATVVTRLELVLEGTPARAAPQRESDLRALSKLIRVLAEAILRHLDRPAVSEKNTGDLLPDEFVRVMHEVIETINNRRQSAKSPLSAMRRWLRTG